MMIHFEFASAFSTALGGKSFQVELAENICTLERAIQGLYQKYPHFQEVFEQKKMIKDGNLNAMFVMGNGVLRLDTFLEDGCLVRVFGPIAGG